MTPFYKNNKFTQNSGIAAIDLTIYSIVVIDGQAFIVGKKYYYEKLFQKSNSIHPLRIDDHRSYAGCFVQGVQEALEWILEPSLVYVNVYWISNTQDRWQVEEKDTCKYGVTNINGNTIIPFFPITINGEKIANYNALYPCIVYNDIACFPLTWRFAVEEFGRDYNFTAEGGLVINSK